MLIISAILKISSTYTFVKVTCTYSEICLRGYFFLRGRGGGGGMKKYTVMCVVQSWCNKSLLVCTDFLPFFDFWVISRIILIIFRKKELIPLFFVYVFICIKFLRFFRPFPDWFLPFSGKQNSFQLFISFLCCSERSKVEIPRENYKGCCRVTTFQISSL